MGCTSGTNSGHQIAINYKVGRKGVTKTHICKDVSSYSSIVLQMKNHDHDLRYQFFYFQTQDKDDEVVHVDNEESFKKFFDEHDKKNMKLHLVFRHFEISMPRDSPRFIDIIPRVVKLLDAEQFIDRIGFMLAPQLVMTSTCKNDGAKPEVQNFVYHNKKKKLFKGDMDTSIKAFFVNFEDLNLCIMQTEEIHTIGFESIRENHHPRNIAYFGSTKNDSCLKMCNLRDVSSKNRSKDGFITYDLSDSRLTTSATGGVLVDTDTWLPIGIHLKVNKKDNKGTGILFNAVIEKLRNTKLTELALFGEVFDLSVRGQRTQSVEPSPEPKRLQPDDDASFNIPTSQVTAIARSLGGMIFTRSAILIAPDKKFVVYDGLTKQFHSEPFEEDFDLGVSISSTINIAVITGVSTDGEPLALSISKKMEKVVIDPPKKQHKFHGSAILANLLYVISGEACADVETYNFQTKEWEDVQSLPRSLTNFATAVSENTLYIGGGEKEGNRASRAIFKLADGEWVRIVAKLPGKLINCAMIPTSSGKVLVLGGIEDANYNDKGTEIDLETGDSDTRIFSTGSNVKIPQDALQVSTVGTHRHILTGVNEVFTVNFDDWTMNRSTIDTSAI